MSISIEWIQCPKCLSKLTTRYISEIFISVMDDDPKIPKIPLYRCTECRHIFASQDTEFMLFQITGERKQVELCIQRHTKELSKNLKRWREETKLRNQYDYL